MREKILVLVAGITGLLLGYSLTANHYKEELLKMSDAYKASVNEARKQEKYWQDKAWKMGDEYQKKLDSMQHSNDELVDRLRKQLDELSSRVPSVSKSSCKSNAGSRRTSASKEVGDLIEFSNNCAKQADILTVQLKGLQTWAKEVNQNGN